MVNIMNLIKDRHSVRQYKDVAVEDEKKALLENYASELSAKSGLRIKVVFDDPEGFNSALARYGRFSNVKNYIALLGNSGMDEAAGYYGEAIVLKAQELGLNTCWVGLTFNKKVVKKLCNPSEKIYCAIALGYGENQGASHKVNQRDTPRKLCRRSGSRPAGTHSHEPTELRDKMPRRAMPHSDQTLEPLCQTRFGDCEISFREGDRFEGV